jgi:hypothetical protein
VPLLDHHEETSQAAWHPDRTLSSGPGICDAEREAERPEAASSFTPQLCHSAR